MPVPVQLVRFGSSPRLRGTLLQLPRSASWWRFIPAPAGNTTFTVTISISSPVHPRACGEHQSFAHWVNPPTGSSPRLRGTPRQRVRLPCNIRFIPAPAGNTHVPLVTVDCYAVHPRACGEHVGEEEPSALKSGSSPRLRGTLMSPRVGLGYKRFIPAPAGNTRPSAAIRFHVSVHPRACGEHKPGKNGNTIYAGSSPRLRGTPNNPEAKDRYVRFIPAPAGNTPLSGARGYDGAVHPRACGEHFTRCSRARKPDGSSPRLRGTQVSVFLIGTYYRFIPAPAGNTTRTNRTPLF